MSEQSGGVQPPSPPELKLKLEPIGMRVLGDVDPRTMTREAFNQSPHLLFHGTAKPFQFSQTYDYSSAEYYTDGSQTIGEGFYTTNARDCAANYSRVRQGKNDATPVVISLLPYQAKVLDLRASSNPDVNAPVPQELFDKWFQFYREYYFRNDNRQKLPWIIAGIENDYWCFLVEAKKLGKPLDLRVMLDTAPDPELKGHAYPHPRYTKLFSTFMRQQGYDGIVYIEGGEGSDRKNHLSYVFYNLETVGTYDSWHQPQSVNHTPLTVGK